MKLITAVIQPFTLPDVRNALEQIDVLGLTVTEAQGFGHQRGQREVYRGAQFAPEYVAKVKCEVVVADDHLESALSAIVEAAHTGNIGDGKVWVTPVEEVVRVRTGERGSTAL